MEATYLISLIDGNRYCKSNGQFTRHLRENGYSYQEYYETFVTGIERKCYCGKPLTFHQSHSVYANSCGNPKCVGVTISQVKQNWTEEQKISDSINKSAAMQARTPKQLEIRRENMKKTNRARYGVDYSTQSTNMKEKSKQTKLERYGDENYSNPEQTSVSWQAKSELDLIKIAEKKRITCLERYGVESTFLIPQCITNSSLSNSLGKEYVFPSGKITRIRGYEDIVINKLLLTYAESEIIIHDMLSVYDLPIFKYVDVNQHTRKYYPDIFIPSENKIIEVKGRYWWDGNGSNAEKYISRLTNNLNKRDSVLTAGFIYEVWLFENKNTYNILGDNSHFYS